MADRSQQTLAITAAIVIIGSIVGWRWLRVTPGVKQAVRTVQAGPSVPSPNVAPLMAYAAPLPDSAVLVIAAAESVSVRRDPFANAEYAKAAPARPHAGGHAGFASSEWRVSATLIGGARRAAVINDVLLYEGDAIPGGGKLTSVERDRVVVTDPHGTTHTVAVKEGDG